MMDVKAFIKEHDSNIDKEYGNLAMSPSTLEWLIGRALAQDRAERECPYCNPPKCQVCNQYPCICSVSTHDPSDLADATRRNMPCPFPKEANPLSADLERLAEKINCVPKERQYWTWIDGEGGLYVSDIEDNIPELPCAPRAAVDAALKEIEKGGA